MKRIYRVPQRELIRIVFRINGSEFSIIGTYTDNTIIRLTFRGGDQYSGRKNKGFSWIFKASGRALQLSLFDDVISEKTHTKTFCLPFSNKRIYPQNDICDRFSTLSRQLKRPSRSLKMKTIHVDENKTESAGCQHSGQTVDLK